VNNDRVNNGRVNNGRVQAIIQAVGRRVSASGPVFSGVFACQPADPGSDRPPAGRTHLLECEARMPGVIEPDSMILAGGLPDGLGESFQAGEKFIFQL